MSTPNGARLSVANSNGGGITPPVMNGPGRTPTMFPLVFGFRKESEFRAYAGRGGGHIPCAYRIIETHRMAGNNSRGFLVRQYLSAG